MNDSFVSPTAKTVGHSDSQAVSITVPPGLSSVNFPRRMAAARDL